MTTTLNNVHEKYNKMDLIDFQNKNKSTNKSNNKSNHKKL
jgi:hypothetical protein